MPHVILEFKKLKAREITVYNNMDTEPIPKALNDHKELIERLDPPEKKRRKRINVIARHSYQSLITSLNQVLADNSEIKDDNLALKTQLNQVLADNSEIKDDNLALMTQLKYNEEDFKSEIEKLNIKCDNLSCTVADLKLDKLFKNYLIIFKQLYYTEESMKKADYRIEKSLSNSISRVLQQPPKSIIKEENLNNVKEFLRKSRNIYCHGNVTNNNDDFTIIGTNEFQSMDDKILRAELEEVCEELKIYKIHFDKKKKKKKLYQELIMRIAINNIKFD